MKIRTIKIGDETFDIGPVTSNADPCALVRYTKSTDEYRVCVNNRFHKDYDWQHARIDMGDDSPVRYYQIYWTDSDFVSPRLRSPKKLFFDMDGVLCDFEAAAVKILDSRGIPRSQSEEYKQMISDCQDIPGFYRDLPPIKGAVESFKTLTKFYDCYICSAPSWTNPTSWTDKYHWVVEHIGGDFAYKRLILTHDKGMFTGRALIDDRVKYNVASFNGEHVMFGNWLFPDWDMVLQYLLPKNYSEGLWVNQHTGSLKFTNLDGAEEHVDVSHEIIVMLSMLVQFTSVGIDTMTTQVFGRDTPVLRNKLAWLVESFNNPMNPDSRAPRLPNIIITDDKITYEQ